MRRAFEGWTRRAGAKARAFAGWVRGVKGISATFRGEGHLEASLKARRKAAATFEGTGTLSAWAKASRRIRATLEGVGTLAAWLKARRYIAATFTGDGWLEASATVHPRSGEPIERQWLTVYEHDLTLAGFALANIRWTERLDGANSLDSIIIPREYLLSDGTTINKLSYLDKGWYLDWDGYRYVVESVEGDLDAGLEVRAVDAATELANYYCSYSPGAATYLNQLPSVIATAILSGRSGRTVRNPGFGILDADDLPTNWTHAAGWTSELVANRRVWQGVTGESVSDDRPSTQGIEYRAKVEVASTGTAGVKLRWTKADGTTVDSDVTYLANTDGDFHVVETPAIAARGKRLHIVLVVESGTAQFDDVALYEYGPDTGWTYDGDMDSRAAAIPYTDGAIQRYGVWADEGDYLEATTAGDYLGRVVNGEFVGVEFAAGGGTALVRVNGVQYEASGSELVRGTTPIDVSTVKVLTVKGLDPTNDHIVEVEAVTGATRFVAFSTTTDNLVSMNWDVATNIYEALASLQKAVGGEIWFDPVNRIVHHESRRGVDLRAESIVEFRRETNIVSMKRTRDRTSIVNRLTGLGYGEGEYQLVVTVDATEARDGETSIEKFGIRRGTYTDKECKSLAAMTATVQRLVEESAWEAAEYRIEVLGEAAALCQPGDTGTFYYDGDILELRILEMRRSTDSDVATLIVGDKLTELADIIVPAARDLSTLQRSFQGTPAFQNLALQGDFDYYYPSECPFFIPYGADVIDLRLRYQIGGMRATAKSVAGGGQLTSNSGGGGTSGGGGGTTATSGQTEVGVTVSPGTTRIVDNNTTDAWATVVAGALSGTILGYLTIFNRSGGNRTFNVQVGTSQGSGNLWTGNVAVANLSITRVAIPVSSGYPVYVRIKPGTESSSSYDFTVVVIEYEFHTHKVTLYDHYHTTPDHTHTIPDHTHDLKYGIHASAPPEEVRIYVDNILIPELSGQVYVSDFDLLPYIPLDSSGRVTEGYHSVRVETASETETGRVTGAVFLQQFLATEGV